MNCPNINIKEVRNEFNSIVEAFGGRPLTIDEFKSKDLRNKRTGVDDNAIQVAYFLWDKTNGDGLAALPEYVNSNISDEYTRIRAVVNKLLGVDEEQMETGSSAPKIKKGVPELFESNPELDNIGTQEQYSRYLNSMFPDESAGDIVYNGAEYTISSSDTSQSYKLGDSEDFEQFSQFVVADPSTYDNAFGADNTLGEEMLFSERKPKYYSSNDIYEKNYTRLKYIGRALTNKIKNNGWVNLARVKKLNDIYTKNENSPFMVDIIDYDDYKTTNEKLRKVQIVPKQSFLEKLRSDAEAEFEQYLNNNEWVKEFIYGPNEDLFSSEQKRSIVDNKHAEVQKKSPNKGVQLNLFDEIVDSQGKVRNNMNRESVELVYRLAKRLSRLTGITFSVVTMDEAVAIRNAKNGTNLTADDARGRGFGGFYDMGTKTAYLVDERMESHITVHEVFGHPILQALRMNPKTHEAYNKLILEAAKYSDEIENIYKIYGKNYKSELGIEDEMIIRVLELHVNNKLGGSRLLGVAREIMREITSFLIDVLNLIPGVEIMRPDLTIERLAEYALYGRGKLGLFDGDPRVEADKAAKRLAKRLNANTFNKLSYGFIKINDILELSNAHALDAVKEWAEENQTSTAEKVIAGIQSELLAVDYESGKIYDYNGSEVASFVSNKDGAYTYISNIDVGKLGWDIVLRTIIARSDTLFPSTIRIASSSIPVFDGLVNGDVVFQSAIERSIAKGIIPKSAVSSVNYNGADYVEIDTLFAKNNEFEYLYAESKISSKTANAHAPSVFIRTVVDGLNAQIANLERKPTNRMESIEKLKDLVDQLKSATSVQAAEIFVTYASSYNGPVMSVSRKVDEMIKKMKSDESIDNALIRDIEVNFLTLYSKAIDNIGTINQDPFSILNVLSDKSREILNSQISSISNELNKIKDQMRNIKTYAYKNQLAIEGAKVGSTTIEKRLSEDIYTENEDVSYLSSVLFGMAFSNKEQMRALHKMVLDVKSKVHSTVESDGVLLNLTEKWNAVKKKSPLSTFERFYEKNKLGKATGYLISDLLYGQFNREYDNFKSSLAKKYKLKSPNDIPEDKKQRMRYLSEKDEWLSNHAERMFTPEYYKLRNSLSEDARQAIDDAGMAIRMFLNKFKDNDGFIDTSLMSPQDLEKFRGLKKAKQNIANLRYADGSAKSGVALDIAIEVSEYNRKISDGLKYKPNYSLFEKKMAEMKSKLSAAEFVKWKSINTRMTYKQEFWDSLDSNAKNGQSKEWQDMYDARANILRIYRNLDSIEVSAARLDSNKTARETVEFFDKKLAETRTKTNGKSNFSEIAEIVPTDEYLFEEEKARNNPNKAAWAEFIKKTHFVGPGGKLTKYSQWTKIQPKDKSMILTEPSSVWSELDKTSAFYNQNYDESRSEDGLQPRRDLYDNSKEFNKIKKDKADYEFYNAVVDAYRKANSMYAYNPNMSPLRLAQITGPFLHKLTHGDSRLKAIIGTLRDKVSYRSYEPGFGDPDSKGMHRADGSPVMFVPTKYRKMLEQPDQISRDLLGSFAMYYSAAVNHKLMTDKVDDIETVMQGIHDTVVYPKRNLWNIISGKDPEVKSEGASSMYKRARDFVKSNVYGYELGNAYNVPIWFKVNGGDAPTISLAKPLKDFLNFVRKINLSGNVVAIFSNYMTAGISSKVEAACGTYMDNESYMAAGLEIAKNMPDIIANSTTGRGNNKVISLMRLMNVVRSNENDMKGLHGSKLVNTISSNFWYGPYTAGDFAVKSRMMVAVMMSNKLFEGEYYNKERFLTKYYPENRADGEKHFNSLSENLYDAFEITKDGLLNVKKQYKDSVSDVTIANIYSILGVLGRKLDGTLTGSERSRFHSDAFASAILLHRGWLVNALQERFSQNIFSYEKQMQISGQYRGDNVSSAIKILWKFLGNKIDDISREGIKGNLNFKMGSMKNEFSGSQLYNSRRILGEVGFLVLLSAITALLSSLIPRNSLGEKDDESAEMWMYVMSLRVSMELFAVYSPADVYNIIGSPTAAEGSLENIKTIFGMFADGSFGDYVESGKYKYKTKLERSAIKLTPGYKQVYERILHPDLEATERFLLGNIPVGPMALAAKVFDRRTEQEKRMEERKKQALKMKKEFEEKNSDRMKEMKKRKREQFNRRPLFGE